jgi:hypothetical protein
MKYVRIGLPALLLAVLALPVTSADAPAKRSAKETLQAFNREVVPLIGPWRATGEPEGTRAEKQKGFWTEGHAWEWQFKDNDAWLQLTIEKGKYFTEGTLRYLPDKDKYELTLTTTDKQTLTFAGTLEDKKLTLERTDEKSKEAQRLVFTFLHENRFLYRYEVKADGKPDFAKVYQVGVTKDDVPFAGAGDNKPECVVSGGLGTIPVTYKGQTYYVCCSGCRRAFNDDPERWLKEFAARKEKEKSEKKEK